MERMEQLKYHVERVELLADLVEREVSDHVIAVAGGFQRVNGYCAWSPLCVSGGDREMPTVGHSCGNCGGPPPAGGVIGHRR